MRIARGTRRLPRGLVIACGLLVASASSLGALDESLEPLLLSSTYLGGTGPDSARKVQVGPDGVVWIAAVTSSIDFPGAPYVGPPIDNCWYDCADIVVVRLDATSGALLSAFRLRGSRDDLITNFAVDDAGNAYLLGRTWSEDFPFDDGIARDWLHDGRPFVARLSADGSGADWVRQVGIDGGSAFPWTLCATADGDVVLIGRSGPDGIERVPADGPEFGGGPEDAFVMRLRADDAGIVFAEFLGGSGDDEGSGICIDPDGGIVVSLLSTSPELLESADWVAGAGPSSEPRQGLLMSLDPVTGDVVHAARLGGALPSALATTRDGVLVVGNASASDGVPAATPPADDEDHVFALHLQGSGWTPRVGAYLDSSVSYGIRGFAVASDGTLWLAGFAPTWLSMPTPGAIRPIPAGNYEAYVAAFEPARLEQTFGSYLGGMGGEIANDVAVAADGTAWIVGGTGSSDFPVRNPLQPFRGMDTVDWTYGDAFATHVAAGDPATRPAVVSDLAATVLDDDTVRVSWRAGDDRATTFAIDRRWEAREFDPNWRGMLPGWERVAIVAGEVREWIDTDVAPDRNYTYSVQAINGSGGSPVSAEPASVWTTQTLKVTVARAHGMPARRRPAGWWGHFPRRWGSLIRVRGVVGRADGDGALDLPRDGFRLMEGDAERGTPILVIPPGDPAWQARGDGSVLWKSGATWLRFDPATGAFDLRVVRNIWSVAELSRFGFGSARMTLRVATGADVGRLFDD